MTRSLPMAALVLLLCSAAPVFASGLTYTCGAGISTSVCTYLQTTVAGLYDSTFSNIDSNVYVQTANIGNLVAQTQQNDNYTTYSSYLGALTTASNGSQIDVDALNALNNLDTAIYGSGYVEVTASLASSLGLMSNDVTGTDVEGDLCILSASNPGCYDAVITLSNSAQFYYRGVGNTNANETSSQIDFFSAVEHETDEALGTASCISTLSSVLLDDCSGTNTPSAVDLFRYQSPGDLVLLSTTAGAYFSYDGGAQNGADGALYNTLANGNDYADFVTYCSSVVIQDASVCPGHDAGLNITNDGPGHGPGPEVNILSAVGYQLSDPVAPEPGSVVMLVLGGLSLSVLRRRRNRPAA